MRLAHGSRPGPGTGERFDPNRAAALELDWWQLRRDHVAYAVYSRTVAPTAAEVYGQTNDALGHSALLRSEMMSYCDDHSHGQLTTADWEHIQTRLQQAYKALKEAVGR